MKTVKAWAHIVCDDETLGKAVYHGNLLRQIFCSEQQARDESSSFVRVAQVEIREVKKRRKK